MTTRHSGSVAREKALQALYQVDLAGADPAEALANAWKDEEEAPADYTLRFSEQLVKGVIDNLQQVDELIEKYSHHWRIDRMSRVDRNVLRLAVYELQHGKRAPPGVVLNEAIELAKVFGTEESGAFVNGILDKIASSVGPRKGKDE